MNIGVQVAFPITAFSGQKPGVGLMDHGVVLFSVLLSLFFGAGGFFFFSLSGPYLQAMEVPRLVFSSDLQLLFGATAPTRSLTH